MEPAYSLRAAELSDLPEMMAIGHEGIRPYVEALGEWNPTEQVLGFREHFTPENILVVQVVQADSGEVANAGYFKLEAHSDHLFLAGIYLSAQHRSRGLGSALLRALIQQAGRQRKPLRLRVLRPNPARRMYERLGFRCISETTRHVVMECGANA